VRLREGGFVFWNLSTCGRVPTGISAPFAAPLHAAPSELGRFCLSGQVRARLGERSAPGPGSGTARAEVIGLRPSAAPRPTIRFVPHASAALAAQVDRGLRFDHQARPQMTALGAAPVAHHRRRIPGGHRHQRALRFFVGVGRNQARFGTGRARRGSSESVVHRSQSCFVRCGSPC